MKRLMSSPYFKIVLTYIAAQFIPAFIVPFVPAENRFMVTIYTTIACFVVGVGIMLWINQTATFPNSIEKSTKPPVQKVILWGVCGTFLAFVAQYAARAIELFIFHLPAGSQNTQTLMVTLGTYPLFILLIAILGPIMEEFVFRKVIFGSLFDITGGIGAAVISSLIFAFVHVDGHILLYSMIGFVFSYLYYKTKSIAVPIIAHSLMNTIVVVASLTLFK